MSAPCGFLKVKVKEERLSPSGLQNQERKQRAKKMEDQSKTTSQAGTDNNAQAELGSSGNSPGGTHYYWEVVPIENKKSTQKQKKKRAKMKNKATMHSKKRKTSDHRTKTSLDNMLKSMKSQTERDESEDEAFIKYEEQKWGCPACQFENTNEGSYCTNIINGKACGTNRPSKIDPKGWGDTFKDQTPPCPVCTTPLMCPACACGK